MRKTQHVRSFVPFYVLVFTGCLMLTVFGSHAITVMTESVPLKGRHCIIIDPGHGGVDGGATSCTGALESNINLEIALRLNDLICLLGYDTALIRTTDKSIYTQGKTIAAKKVSDLKERVRIVNDTEKAILVSIHQNYFTDSRYSGAQVFYANNSDSIALAKEVQKKMVSSLNPGSSRQEKKAAGIYLMDHINCTGILVECGFLSNPSEEAKLRDPEYQIRLCCVIATSIGNYLDQCILD